MKIYLSHASNYDYQKKLYEPIKELFSNRGVEVILPHEQLQIRNTKDVIKNCDLIIAEVSFSSTGQGIELGWADINKIPIICLYQENSKISSSIELITREFIEYQDTTDMINQLSDYLDSNFSKNKQVYKKLVRDKIPEIIKKNGEKPIIRILEESLYKQELNKKLDEEFLELKEAIALNDLDKIKEESADLIEVIRVQNNNDLESILLLMEDKKKKRGSFLNKIFLEEVIEDK